MGTASPSCSTVNSLKESVGGLLPSKCGVVKSGAKKDSGSEEKILTPEELEKKRLQELEAKKQARRCSISVLGFKGDWKDDRKHGKGTFTYENGDTYTGEWVKDKAHGTGTYRTNHSIFVGQWIEDLKSGEGEETHIDEQGEKTIYKGYFHQGHREGKGALKWPDGSMYEGDFQQDQLQGVGTFKFKNGQQYSGQVSENNIHGAGRYQWPDGTYYEGQYVMGMKHGDGTFLLKTGNIMKCLWRDGKPFGPVTFKAKELAPPLLDWYDGVMVSWATRSDDGTPREGKKKRTGGLFSPRNSGM